MGRRTYGAATAFACLGLVACGGRTAGDASAADDRKTIDGGWPDAQIAGESSTSEPVTAPDAVVADAVDATVPPRSITTDNTFGMAGSVWENFSPEGIRWTPCGIAVGADGRVFVAGLDDATPSLEIVRAFTPTGAPDRAFGVEGQITIAADPTKSPQSLGLLADGRLATAGPSISAAGPGLFAIRTTPAGRPDPTWADGGIWTNAVAGLGIGAVFEARGSFYAFGADGGLSVAGDGSIVAPGPGLGWPAAIAAAIAGDTLVTALGWSVTRSSLATGAPDPTFGDAGTSGIDFGDAGYASSLRALSIDGRGRIVVVADHDEGGRTYVDVLRLTAAGAVDRSFAPTGPVSVAADVVIGAGIRADGSIVIWTAGGAIVRIRDDGTPDETIGPRGVAWPPVLGAVFAGTIDGAGRLILVGEQTTTATGGWFINRYWL